MSGQLGQRMAARPAHLGRLQALQDEGRLLLAGPFPAVDAIDPGTAGFTGSLIVAEFASLQAAREWPRPTVCRRWRVQANHRAAVQKGFTGMSFARGCDAPMPCRAQSVSLDIIDESLKHAGHAGARDGAGTMHCA